VGGRLSGKVVIVTGGSSGIGRASALRFAEEGASVVVGDVREDPREGGDPTHILIAERGGQAAFVRTDVSKADQAQRLVAETIEQFGGLHAILTAAGNVGPQGDSRMVDIGEWDSHFALNVRGTFLCAQAALRHMAEERYGKVVLIASNFGLVGVPELTAYCAGKAAVIGMARALAGEFGPHGVNVNALCPGATKTSINVHFRSDPERQANWQRMTPLRMDKDDYIADPPDIANAALYLVSDESRFMTGATLVVDGGWIAL
jgi:NAD(P)-dependent dehydrogenase (short-subunit alcohol dehydrogenase family)